MQYKGIVASSQDSTQIANTVKGVIVGLSSVIILVAASFFHITLTATDILSLATDAGVAAGAIWTLYGLLLKLVVYFGEAR